MRAQDVAPGVSITSGRPAWALPELALPAPNATDGTEVLAREDEWHVEGPSALELVRLAYVVHTAASVADRSELEISVAAGEEVALLGIRRTRGTDTEDVLRPELVRVIQPEERLEDRLYDGSRRILVFLEDVRAGDTIDYAYVRTISMARFGGRFARRALLDGEPTRRMRFAARWDANRAIRVLPHELERAHLRRTDPPNGIVIEGDDLTLPDLVLDAPSWVDPFAWIEMSEFASWAEVAAWAVPNFQTPDGAPIDGAPLETFRALPTEAERAQAALRFVQDEIRYLGIEVEESAHVPSAPDVVARRRYGDCKDKALLLVALLRALGVEAHVALVDTERGHVLESGLPSPIAFDHAVVVARIDGVDTWMDATRSYEREPISALPPLRFERGLVVDAGSAALTPIPAAPPAAPDMEIDEHFTLVGREALALDATFRRGEAAGWRAIVARDGLDAVADTIRESYAHEGLAPEDAEPIRAEEDDDGAITFHVRYTVHGFWNAIERDVSAWSSADALPEPADDRPPLPLAIAHPRWTAHHVVIETRDPWNTEPSEEHVAGATFDLTRRITVARGTLTIDTDFRTLTNEVPADEIGRYVAERERAQNALGYAVFLGTDDPPTGLPFEAWVSIGVAIVLVFAALAAMGALRRRIGRWIGGRRRRAWDRSVRAADGESPSAAIEVASLEDAQRRAQPLRCCDGTMEPRWTRAQLGGAPAIVQSATCDVCDRTQRRYYRARPSAPTVAEPSAE